MLTQQLLNRLRLRGTWQRYGSHRSTHGTQTRCLTPFDQGQDFLANAIRFFKVRRAGQDECIGSQLDQLVQTLGHLLIAANDALGLSATKQRKTRPDIGLDDEILVAADGLGSLTPGLSDAGALE